MAVISVSKSGLPGAAQDAARLLYSYGYRNEAEPYVLTAAEASSKKINAPVLSILLRTVVDSAPTKKSVLRNFVIDHKTGAVGFELNHSLTP